MATFRNLVSKILQGHQQTIEDRDREHEQAILHNPDAFKLALTNEAYRTPPSQRSYEQTRSLILDEVGRTFPINNEEKS